MRWSYKFEVERYSWLTAQTIWGPLRHIPGLTEQAKRSVERIDDPAQFCFQLTGDFMSVDVGNILDTAGDRLLVGCDRLRRSVSAVADS